VPRYLLVVAVRLELENYQRQSKPAQCEFSVFGASSDGAKHCPTVCKTP
jgi:hypothetical protein